MSKYTRYILIFLAVLLAIAASANLLHSERFLAPSEQVYSSDRSRLTESPSANTALAVWWEKGYNPQEDEALKKLVGDWEKKTGNKIELFLSSSEELFQKALRASKVGNLPDLILSCKGERSLSIRLAWEGKLADVSDVIESVKHLYPKNVLESANLYNKAEKRWGYYGIPIHQATNHVYYWKDLLEQVGRNEKDIPKDWDGFWQFWTKIQDELRTKQKLDIYGLGLPVSIEAGDTFQTFEQILEAYDVTILDSKGQLQVDKPQVRQGIVKVLNWYEQFYQQGYIPPDALRWLNPDNNRSLLNHKILMTINRTLSIPAAVRQDPNLYRNKLGILELPNKPNGKPMRHLITVEQALVFATSKHQKLAKDFIAYILQPKVMGEYLKAAGGRYAPVQRSIWNDPFWTDPREPHISVATKTITQTPTRTYYTFQNPTYNEVLQENVWGKALRRVLVDRVSSEQAADEAIARIKQIFTEWGSR